MQRRIASDKTISAVLRVAASDREIAVPGSAFGAEIPVLMKGGGPFHWAPGEWTDDTSMAIPIQIGLISRRRFEHAFRQIDEFLLDLLHQGRSAGAVHGRGGREGPQLLDLLEEAGPRRDSPGVEDAAAGDPLEGSRIMLAGRAEEASGEGCGDVSRRACAPAAVALASSRRAQKANGRVTASTFALMPCHFP